MLYPREILFVLPKRVSILTFLSYTTLSSKSFAITFKEIKPKRTIRVMKKKLIGSVFLFYTTLLIFLAVRPKISYLYNNFLPGSDIGGWNMYQYLLKTDVDVFIVSNNNDTTRINWEKHFYHSKFASSAHPNFLYNHANRFLQFLDKNCVEIQEFRKNNDKGYLNINVNIIKERYDTTTTNIVVSIN